MVSVKKRHCIVVNRYMGILQLYRLNIKFRIANSNSPSWSTCIVFLPLIEILTKIINHTNKETYLKAPHPVIYGGVLITSTKYLVTLNG
jgi:hypothetical protein